MTFSVLAIACLISAALWAILILTAPMVLFFFLFGLGVWLWAELRPSERFTSREFEDHGRRRL